MLIDDETTARINETERSVEPTTYWTTYRAPIGEILLVADGSGLRRLHLPGFFAVRSDDRAKPGTSTALDRAVEQLEAYFAGELKTFDLPLAPEGTSFQQRVWWALADIAYAETESYGSVAARIGNPRAGRAVGMANNRNPLPILFPCHRVIGANGSLVGYGGGLPMKEWLLEHEAAVVKRTGASPG